MSNAVKLINGGTIQVRTGVLAGIGPMGPRGPIGLKGDQGPTGPVGEQGIQGQILQIAARAVLTTAQTCAPGVDLPIAFTNVAYDDMGVFISSTNMQFLDAGDYQIAGYLVFAAGSGGGRRNLKLRSIAAGTGTQSIVWEASGSGTASQEVAVELHCNYRIQTAGEQMQLLAQSRDTVNVDVVRGYLTVTRIGSGPVGPEGPQGPAGPQGVQGVQGAKGDPGNASSGFSTYGAIDNG